MVRGHFNVGKKKGIICMTKGKEKEEKGSFGQIKKIKARTTAHRQRKGGKTKNLICNYPTQFERGKFFRHDRCCN